MNTNLIGEISEYCIISTGILFNDQISLNVNRSFPAKSVVEEEEPYSATKKTY
jgi:hypothetical protein